MIDTKAIENACKYIGCACGFFAFTTMFAFAIVGIDYIILPPVILAVACCIFCGIGYIMEKINNR